MRSLHESLRYGSLIFLDSLTINNEPHNSVFAFSRTCPEETAIIAINFHNVNTSYKLDLKNLLPVFDFEINFNSVCFIEDWINETKGDFYFLREVISEDHTRNIQALSSICYGFQLVENTRNNYKLAMEKSLSRLFSDYNNGKSIDNYQLTLQLKYILEKELPLEDFSKWFLFAQEKLAKYNVLFINFYKKISFLKTNEILAQRFFGYANTITLNYRNINESLYNNLDLIVKQNYLGPICFSTPEIGRWSTIGGLGVMVIIKF